MYRIAVEDLRTRQIGLVSKDGKIQEFNNLDDVKRVYELMKSRLHPGKDIWVFNTTDKLTRQNVWDAINTEQLVEQLMMLKERYADEHGHENENEYVQYAMKNIHERTFKMTKRPFGFVIKCLDGYLQIGIKSEGIYYKTFAKNYDGKVK